MKFIPVNNMPNLKLPEGYTTEFDNTGDCIRCSFCDDNEDCVHPAGASNCGCMQYDVVFVKE